MSYARDREETIAALTRNGVPLEVARRVLRYAATLQRLAVAQCNGDWPADNGERDTVECEPCGTFWHPSVIKRGLCPDCRITELLEAALAPYPVKVHVGGDPRGYVVKLMLPNAEHNTWGGVQEGWGVAARG